MRTASFRTEARTAVAAVFASVCLAAGASAAIDPQVDALDRLRAASSEPLRVRFQGATPRTLWFDVAASGATPVEQARDFLDEYADLFLRMAAPSAAAYGDDLPRVELLARGVWDEGELVAVGFYQTIGGIPVFGGELVVTLVERETSASRIVSASGALLPALQVKLDLTPTIQPSEALLLAAEHLDRTLPETSGAPRLVVYAPAIDGGAGESRLAWAVVVASGPLTEVLVDADNGQVLFDHVFEQTTEGLDGFDMDLETAHGLVNAVDTNCFYATTEEESIGDEDGVDADWQDDLDAAVMWESVRDVYSYYHDELGLHSFDGDDAQIETYIDSNFGANNARFVPGCLQFEFFLGAVSLDIVGHEFTHAVIRFSPSNLVYRGESGALNESFADLFGEMAERDTIDWLQGARSLDGLGAIRSLEDPLNGLCLNGTVPCGQPDRWSVRCTSDADCNYTGDQDGVHTNSGIGNKAAYVMSEGGVHNGIYVASPLRPTKLGKLAYHVMRYLPSKSTYQGAADYYIATARSWAKYGTNGFDTDDACAVQNAWATVELAGIDSDCDYVDDATQDTDGDGWLDFVYDNCLTVPNPTQDNWDSDTEGDACDDDDDGDGCPDGLDLCPDFVNLPCGAFGMLDFDNDDIGNECDIDVDGDGYLNGGDNCDYDFNPDQADVNSDGQGDACQPDDDGDGIVSELDNCQFVANAGQDDSDSDGMGDACDACPGKADQVVGYTPAYPGIPPKPIQPDSDGDGTPDACDGLGFDRAGWTFDDSQIDPNAGLQPGGRSQSVRVFGDPGRLHVPLALCGDDADVLGSDERVELVVDQLPDEAPIDVWIGDERGLAVRRLSPENGSGLRGLRFQPDCIRGYQLHVDLGDRFAGDATFLLSLQVVPGDDENPWARLDPRHDYVVPVVPDADDDGWLDERDNCPDDVNVTQADADLDGIGDVCDNCEIDANEDQADAEHDGVGDVCDNCPQVVNLNQLDSNTNGIGDACELGATFELKLAKVTKAARRERGSWKALGAMQSAALEGILQEADASGVAIELASSAGAVDAASLGGMSCQLGDRLLRCENDDVQVRITRRPGSDTATVRIDAHDRGIAVPAAASAPLSLSVVIGDQALLEDSAATCTGKATKLVCQAP